MQYYGSEGVEPDILAIMAGVITDKWEVTPGYAQELARQLRHALAKRGVTITWTNQ